MGKEKTELDYLILCNRVIVDQIKSVGTRGLISLIDLIDVVRIPPGETSITLPEFWVVGRTALDRKSETKREFNIKLEIIDQDGNVEYSQDLKFFIDIGSTNGKFAFKFTNFKFNKPGRYVVKTSGGEILEKETFIDCVN